MAFLLSSAAAQMNKTAGITSTLKKGINALTFVANVVNDYVVEVAAGAFSVAFATSGTAQLFDDNGVLIAQDAKVATTLAAGKYHLVAFSDVVGNQNVTATFTAPVTVLTEQQKTDAIRLTLLKNKVKAGQTLQDDDVIFYMIGGDSVVAEKVMQTLDNGGGYDDLKLIGLTETQTIDVLAIYNIKVAPQKYEAELGIDAIETDKMLFKSFLDYLQTNNVEKPDFTALYASIRAKPVIYSAVRQWNKTRAI